MWRSRPRPTSGGPSCSPSATSDPGAQACRAEAIEVLLGYLREAIADEIPRPQQLLEPLSLAWGGALYAWAHGQLGLEEVDRRLQRTARLLIAGLHAECAEHAERAARSRRTEKPRGRTPRRR